MRFQIGISSFLILASLALVGASCGQGGTGRAAGFYLSTDLGSTWTQSNDVFLEDGSQQSLARYDITDLELDKSEPNTLYAATRQAGLYKSNDGGESWIALTTKGKIQSLAINPLDTAQLAAARGNQLFFSSDQGKIWNLVYTNPSGHQLTDVAFDQKRNGRLYISLVTGEFLGSVNSGATWSLLNKFKKPVIKLMAHSQQSGLLFALTTRPDILRSTDGGKNWTTITETIDRGTSFFQGIDFVVHPRNMNYIILATQTRLILSKDGGITWNDLPLISSAQSELIQSVAFDPNLINVLYYTTPTVFYRSDNAGFSWSNSVFSSNKLPKELLIDPQNSKRVYIGTHS